MNELNITAKITVYSYDELSDTEKNLITAARLSSAGAYAPYSRFFVGAALLLDNGEVITGNNQENAASPSGLCAERVTLFGTHARFPDVPVRMMALAAQTRGAFTRSPITPCGACRQVLLESEMRLGTPIRLLMYGRDVVYVADTVQALLPLHFGQESLNG